MGLLASRLYRIDANADDPIAPAPQPLFQPAFQSCTSADPAALETAAAPARSTRPAFDDVRHAEYRHWLTRLFGGPILVRLDRHQARAPRLLVRYQGTRDCALPDDREQLVSANPVALSVQILDEAAEYLWALWKADGRPDLFEVLA